jgi:hypothetical protein
MRNKLGGFCLLTALAIALLALPSLAGTTQPVKRVSSPAYDVSKEVTLSGTVSSVKASVPGKMLGGHLFLASGSSTVDAHLGPYALKGTHGVKVNQGEKVKLVGVMTNLHGSQVFLVRKVEAGDRTYTIRNEKGFPVLMGATQATGHPASLVSAGGGR